MFNPLANAFGLDIGDQSFKLTQLKKVRNSNQYRLTSMGSIEVPPGVMKQGTIVDRKEAAALVTRLMKTAIGRPKGRGVVACLPEAKTFIKIIDASSDSSAKSLERAVLREIEQNIPLSRNEIYFDWQLVLPNDTTRAQTQDGEQTIAEPTEQFETFAEVEAKEEPEQDANESEEENEVDKDPRNANGFVNSQKPQILIGAAPKELVNQYTDMLDLASLTPIAFEIEATAIGRTVIPLGRDLTYPIGILDIGATRSSLVVYDRNMIQMSISIPVAGTSITEAISKSLKVSLEDAETLKIECGLDADRCEDTIWSVLQPQIEDLTQKIKNALRFYKIGVPGGRNIEHLLVCGGGANFREIDSVLSRKLAIKVRRADALINVHKPPPKKFAKMNFLSFSTAIGLAMRAAEESSRNMNRLR